MTAMELPEEVAAAKKVKLIQAMAALIDRHTKFNSVASWALIPIDNTPDAENPILVLRDDVGNSSPFTTAELMQLTAVLAAAAKDTLSVLTNRLREYDRRAGDLAQEIKFKLDHLARIDEQLNQAS